MHMHVTHTSVMCWFGDNLISSKSTIFHVMYRYRCSIRGLYNYIRWRPRSYEREHKSIRNQRTHNCKIKNAARRCVSLISFVCTRSICAHIFVNLHRHYLLLNYIKQRHEQTLVSRVYISYFHIINCRYADK